MFCEYKIIFQSVLALTRAPRVHEIVHRFAETVDEPDVIDIFDVPL